MFLETLSMRQTVQLANPPARNHKAGPRACQSAPPSPVRSCRCACAREGLQPPGQGPVDPRGSQTLSQRPLCPSLGLKIKADAASPGSGEAILAGGGAAEFAPDLFPDLSLTAQHLHGSCQSPELTPLLDDSRRKKISCSCFSFSLLGKTFQLGAGRGPGLMLHSEETLS